MQKKNASYEHSINAGVFFHAIHNIKALQLTGHLHGYITSPFFFDCPSGEHSCS
jgi:hypothetical protein